MAAFRYIAIDSQGRTRRGDESAATADEARAALAAKGWTVQGLEEVLVIESVPGPSLSSAEAAVIAGRMADVARLGLPLESGLRAVAEEAPTRRLRTVLNGLATDLERGQPLEAAFAARRGRLPEHLLHLIKAGVETQSLPFVLERYVQTVRGAAEIRRRMWLGLAYPAVLAFAGGLIVLAFLVWIVPQFGSVFLDFDISLPYATVALLDVSRFLRAYGLWILIGLAIVLLAGGLGLAAFLRTVPGRRFVCSIPVLGPLLRLTALAEFAHLLGQFLETRTELPRALELAGEGSGDPEIAWASRGLASETRNGVPLSDAATLVRGVPYPMRQMLRWSNNPQRFVEALLSAAEMCTARASVQAVILGPMLEPVALLAAMIVFGILIVTIFVPVMTLLGHLV